MTKRRRVGYVLATASVAMAVGSAQGQTLTKVRSFGVGEYTSCGWSDIDLMVDGANYFHAFVSLVPGYLPGGTWNDGFVKESHMDDPQGANSNGEDYIGIDPSGTTNRAAISYFAGHGWCGSGGNQGRATSSVSCTDSSDCTTVPTSPSGLLGPAACRNRPSWGKECHWRYSHELVTCQSGASTHGFSKYSIGYSADVRLGEGSSPANWAGYGTNGSINAAFFDTSCGAHVGTEYYDLGGAFAGVSLVGATHVVEGDTSESSERGYYAGLLALYYPTASVKDVWVTTPTYVTQGAGCPVGSGNPGGFNGCGGNIILALDNSTARAQSKHNETWVTIRDESVNSLAASHGWYFYQCNYDCWNTWPIAN